jgi:serine/threonine protein kinase
VKFLRKALIREPAVVERFLREAQTVAALAHPNIVAIESIGRTPGGGWFLVMNLVDGVDLDRALMERPVSGAQAAAWIASAARVVQFANERRIIHCDLKPGNLLLDTRGAIWVTDFGLALRQADEAPAAVLAGTPAFMAPEQVDPCWGAISPRTDVWGLGAVLYYLLYGRPPHQGRDVPDTLAKVVAGTPVKFSLRMGLPRQAVDVCRRALSKRPAERYATAGELAAALAESSSRCSAQVS